jgi:hypothetical protein
MYLMIVLLALVASLMSSTVGLKCKLNVNHVTFTQNTQKQTWLHSDAFCMCFQNYSAKLLLDVKQFKPLEPSLRVQKALIKFYTP